MTALAVLTGVLFVAAVLLLTTFVLVERRSAHPAGVGSTARMRAKPILWALSASIPEKTIRKKVG